MKKLIILDNACSHRNETIKELINKDNTLLYSVPYQHFTNAIEHYFCILKLRLQKLEGLISSHKRDEKYVKNRQENQVKISLL